MRRELSRAALVLGALALAAASACASPTARHAGKKAATARAAAVPGDPRNAEKGLRVLGACLAVYGGQHLGAFPNDMVDLLRDMEKNRYAYADVLRDRNPVSVFSNPDCRFSDSPSMRQAGSHAIAIMLSPYHSVRNDLELQSEGRNDVLAYTNLYLHRRSGKEYGFYVVLWGDGRVTRPGPDQVLYVPMGGGDYGTGFAGQTGLPAGTLTREQFMGKAHVAR